MHTGESVPIATNHSFKLEIWENTCSSTLERSHTNVTDATNNSVMLELAKLARSKSFGLAGDLKNHMLAHSGEKLHKCMSCNKSCGRAGDLRDHMLTHTGEKPHSCTDCNKSFRKARSLRTHHHIGCISPLCIFKCVLKWMREWMHNHTGCICLTFLHCWFSNVSSKRWH